MGGVRVDPLYLRLSEGHGSDRGPARFDSEPECPVHSAVAERFDDLLALAERARSRGYDALAEEYLDRIVAEVCPDDDGPGHGRAA
jgi:hypothetical protein